MKGLLDGTVKLLIFQFSFSNMGALPAGLFEKKRETLDELTARHSGIKGVQFLEPVKDVSVLLFLSELAKAGYTMVDAFFQMRTGPRGNKYPSVRFLFASEDSVRLDGEFAGHKQLAEEVLLQMCQQAMWRVRGFLNPLFKNGMAVDGQHAISINLEARSPLFDNMGNPVTKWERDGAGEKIGDGPVSFEPKLFLRIAEDDISVVSAS